MTVELDSRAQWLEFPIRIMNHIIPVGIMEDIITGMVTGIIPIRQVVIIGVPATLGIIDRVRPGKSMIPIRGKFGAPCSKNRDLDKGEIRWT